jgi:hypothetical protein
VIAKWFDGKSQGVPLIVVLLLDLSGLQERRVRLGNGGKGIRTPDLLIANETLYQLSYTPN